MNLIMFYHLNSLEWDRWSEASGVSSPGPAARPDVVILMSDCRRIGFNDPIKLYSHQFSSSS